MRAGKGNCYKLLFLLLGLNSSTLFAANQLNLPCFSYIAALSVGPAFESGGNTQNLILTPDVEKTYTANTRNQTLAQGEIFLGVEQALRENLWGQLGLAVLTTSNAKLTGNIWDDENPEFNNYTYQYYIRHTHVAVKGKLLFDAGYWVQPWISASVGVGFNRAYSFNNTPIIFEAVKNPNFTNKSTTAFAYTVGIGLQRVLNQNCQVGVGYEFSDWGKSQLGSAPGQTSGNGLSLSHFYTNALMFNLTYLA